MVTLVALLGVGAAQANAASPTIPANRPTPLAGATNGEVPRSRLINVIPHCTAAREAAPSLARLFTMALLLSHLPEAPSLAILATHVTAGAAVYVALLVLFYASSLLRMFRLRQQQSEP